MRKLILLCLFVSFSFMLNAQSTIVACNSSNKLSISSKDFTTNTKVVECTGNYSITALSFGVSMGGSEFAGVKENGNSVTQKILDLVAKRTKGSEINLEVTMISKLDKTETKQNFVLVITD